MDIEKYIEALNNLLGTDHAYYQGDKNVGALVELIVTANKLFEENKMLNTELQITRAYIHDNGLEWDLITHYKGGNNNVCRNERIQKDV